MHPARLPLTWRWLPLLLVATHAALDPPAHHLHHAPRRANDPTRPSQNWRCETPHARCSVVGGWPSPHVLPTLPPCFHTCLDIDRRLRFGAGRCRGFKHVEETPPYLYADVQGVQGEQFVYVPMRKAGSSYITEVRRAPTGYCNP